MPRDNGIQVIVQAGLPEGKLSKAYVSGGEVWLVRAPDWASAGRLYLDALVRSGQATDEEVKSLASGNQSAG